MSTRTLALAALAAFLTVPAYAADTSSSANTSAPNNAAAANNQQTAQNLPQEIRTKLKDDGFSDIKIVPGSFIVSAKDKRGEPVTMMIGPESMMVLTQVTPGTGSSTNNAKK